MIACKSYSENKP